MSRWSADDFRRRDEPGDNPGDQPADALGQPFDNVDHAGDPYFTDPSPQQPQTPLEPPPDEAMDVAASESSTSAAHAEQSAPSAAPVAYNLADSGFTCMGCGYDLTGNTLGGHCPECGMKITVSDQMRVMPTSGYAITSMVLGITALPLCMCYALPTLILSPLALVFWYLAKQQIATGYYTPASHSLAVTGLVTGIIGLAMAVGGWGFIILMIIINA